MNQNWWHESIVYQIYPKSFMDSSGDGVGDLQGIIRRLDYLQELGVNTVWLCPTFPSPMVDGGYDISDCKGVNPQFGTLADMDELVEKAGQRGIKVLLDLVLNHTSDQHPWFQAALRDPASPYRQYYIFKKGVNGGPPNNWRSNFGGSAWEPVPGSDEYYLHVFAAGQPDLNWENPAMRRELYEMIRWWMARGIAGFRIDAISFIKKDPAFPSLPPDGPDGLAGVAPASVMQPGIEAFLAEMRDEAFKPGGAFTVAEANAVPPEKLEEFVGPNGFFSTIFDFSYTDIDLNSGEWHDLSHFTRRQLRNAIFSSQLAVSRVGYGAPYLENHDQNRSPNKFLAEAERTYAGKTMLGVLYFFLQGIPFIYQGQELGMENHPWQALEQFDDVACRDQYDRALRAGYSEQAAFACVANRARDNSRTPMPWSGGENAGFTTGRPWLPIHPDYAKISVEAQSGEGRSVLSFYKEMVRVRKTYPQLFAGGSFTPVLEEEEQAFAYQRSLDGVTAWVVCNFSAEGLTAKLPRGRVLLSNTGRAGVLPGGETQLSPLEVLVLLAGE